MHVQMGGLFSFVSLIGFFSVFVLYVQRVYFSQSILIIPSAKNWSQLQQGYLQGAFYFGYLLVQVFAGILCKVIGGRLLAVFSMFFAAITFMLIPTVTDNAPFGIFVLLRTIMGAAQGALYPAIMAVLGIEIPKHSKSSVVNFVFSGGQAGSVFVLLMSPFLFGFLTLCISNDITSIAAWQLQFIVLGFLGILVTFSWLLYMLIASPLSSKKSLGQLNDDDDDDDDQQQQQHYAEPELSWMVIFSKRPFWAYVGTCAAYNWFMMIIISFLPKLLRFLLHFGTNQQQILSAIPYFGFWVFTVFTGLLTDYLVFSKKFALKSIRKGTGILGYLLCAILLLVLGIFFDISTSFTYGRILNFILISAVVCMSGICKGSFGPNGLDLCRSPVNIGKVTGAAFFAVSLVGIVSPMIASVLFQIGGCTDTLTEPASCYMAWRIIFFISAGVNLGSAILWGTWLSTSPILPAIA